MSNWVKVAPFDEIPKLGARVVRTKDSEQKEFDIGVFRTEDDRIFAINNSCPHKGGPLSQGIVHGHSVTCPLHNWVIGLETGEVKGPDQGCARKVKCKVENGVILIEQATLLRQVA